MGYAEISATRTKKSRKSYNEYKRGLLWKDGKYIYLSTLKTLDIAWHVMYHAFSNEKLENNY